MKRLLIPISALFLAACGAANAPVTDAPTEVNSDTVLDDQLFQEATSGSNLAKCDEIIDSTRKDECKMVVNSFLITTDAVAKLDKSLCEDIDDGRYQENCENRVNEIITKNEEDERTLGIEEEALKLKDANICNEIKDQNQIYSCKYNVLVSLAMEQGDTTICEQIGNAAMIQECKNNAIIED